MMSAAAAMQAARSRAILTTSAQRFQYDRGWDSWTCLVGLLGEGLNPSLLLLEVGISGYLLGLTPSCCGESEKGPFGELLEVSFEGVWLSC